MKFSQMLQQARLKKDWSMNKVAQKVGISGVYYRNVEIGKMYPFPLDKIDYKLLAETLDIPQEDLEVCACQDRGKVEIDVRKLSEETLRYILKLSKIGQ